MLVPHIGGLEGIGLRLHLEDQVDDVLERQIMGVRAMPAAPAQVIAHAFRGNAGERVVDGVDAPPGELAIAAMRTVVAEGRAFLTSACCRRRRVATSTRAGFLSLSA